MIPDLSIVIVTLEGGAILEQCLTALISQVTPSIEVLAPWDGNGGDVSDLSKRFPGVRFLHVDGPRTYAELRAHGVRSSRGTIVALTEDHCVPAADWCRQILSSHRAKHAAIGGAIEKEQPDTALNWAFYFADYVRYLNPAEGPSEHLTDCNVTYKRAALDAIAGVWLEEFHENTVHAAFKARGETLWLTPHIVVRQKRTMKWRPALWDRYAFGRLFGSTSAEGASFRMQMARIAASPILPVLLLVRAAGHVFRTGRYKAAFLRALPSLALLSVTWTLGESIGHLTRRAEIVLRTKADVTAR